MLPLPFPSWLARSKTLPHRQLVSLVHHVGLQEKLGNEPLKKLTLITAPAGYGKSTFLSQWRQTLLRRVRYVAWLSLDSDDNESHLLTTYLLLALYEAGLKSEVAEYFPSGPDPKLPSKQTVAMIRTLLEQCQESVFLILDNFEVLSALTILETVEPIIRYQPDNLHIVIASRSTPPLQLSSLRVQGVINDIDSSHLKFTRSEIRSMFGEALDERMLDVVEQRTEGWPVALQILKSAISRKRNDQGLSEIIYSYEPTTSQYLSEQFLATLPARHRYFLHDTAMLDVITPMDADYLRCSDDSVQILREMTDLEAFIVPLDDGDHAYRLHPLLRDFLRSEGRRNNPTTWNQANLRAAEWFARHGNIIRAMRYCIAADAPDKAGEVLEQADGILLWFREGISRVQLAIQLLPEEVVESRPRLRLLRSLVYFKEGKLRAARESFLPFERQSDQADPESAFAADLTLAALTMSAYEGSPLSADLTALISANGSLPGAVHEEKRACARSMSCLCELHQGNWLEAEAYAQKAFTPLSSTKQQPYGELFLYLHLGLIALKTGNVPEAGLNYRKARSLARRDYANDKDIKLASDILYAEFLCEKNMTSKASKLLKELEKRLARREAWYEIAATGYSLSASLLFEKTGLDGALLSVDKASRYVYEEGLEPLKRLLLLTRIFLFACARDLHAGMQLVRDHNLALPAYCENNGCAFPVRERYLAMESLARLHIAAGDYDFVVRHLAGAITAGIQKNHFHDVEKIRPLLAIALFHDSDEDEAFSQLTHSLAFAQRTGLIYSLVNKSAILEPLLSAYSASAHNQNATFTRSMLQMMRSQTQRLSPQLSRRKALLSPREQDVISELARGWPDKTIARSLNISTNTVHFHLKRIFRKLGVDSRTSAVRRAQELRLL